MVWGGGITATQRRMNMLHEATWRILRCLHARQPSKEVGGGKTKFCVAPVLLALLHQPLQYRKYFCQPCIDGEANPLTVRRHTRCSAYGKAWLLLTRWTCPPQRSIRVHEPRFLANSSAVAVPSVGVAHGATVRVRVASCEPTALVHRCVCRVASVHSARFDPPSPRGHVLEQLL
jgi:hypothetical protein